MDKQTPSQRESISSEQINWSYVTYFLTIKSVLLQPVGTFHEEISLVLICMIYKTL